MFHNYEEELAKIIKNEWKNRGVSPSDCALGRVRACINELKRRNVPLDKARRIAKVIAQIAVEGVNHELPNGGVEGLLSSLSSCRVSYYQLRRNESIYCPIMVPRSFIAVSIISIASSGNISFFIKRVGEPIDDNAYYAEDTIFVGYFDTNKATWTQGLGPGLYLVQVHNYYNESVVVTVDVMTCVLAINS